MRTLVEMLELYDCVDLGTFAYISLFCVWALYAIRERLLNNGTMAFLFPIFMALAVSVYALCVQFGLFSPKNHADWIAVTTLASAAGCALGILALVAVRRLHEALLERAHQRSVQLRNVELAAAAAREHQAMAEAGIETGIRTAPRA